MSLVEKMTAKLPSATKASAETAEYTLKVRFMDAYATGINPFNYHSNPQGTKNDPLGDLLRRVLHGTVKGRYEWAILYDNREEGKPKVMCGFKAGGVEVPAAEAADLARTGTGGTCLIRAWVLPNRLADPRWLKYCKGDTNKGVTWRSMDTDHERGGIYGYDVALYDLLLRLRAIRPGYAKCTLYDASRPFGSPQKELAVVNHLGAVVFKDRDFERQIKGSLNYSLGQLGVL